MKSMFVAVAMAIGVTGVAASAQEAQQDAPREKKVCRSEKMTGALTRRTRIGMTEAQWRELNARTQRGVSEMQGTASGSQEVANNRGAGG